MMYWIQPLIVVPFLLAIPARGDNATQPQPSRTDTHQDELPDGAVARLGSVRWRLLGEPKQIVTSPAGSMVMVTTDRYTLEFLDAVSGERRPGLGIPTRGPVSGRRMPAAFSQNGKKFAACIVEDRWKVLISIWGTAGNQQERRIEFTKKNRAEPLLPPAAKSAGNRASTWSEYVSAQALSPDGQLLAASIRYHFQAEWWKGGENRNFFEMEENRICLWDVSTGKELFELTDHKKEVKGVFFSPDGRTLTTADRDGLICFWDAATGREKRARWKSALPLFCAACSPDGELLAGGSRESVLIWEAATGKLRHRLAIPASEVQSVTFARDGVALAGAGGRVVRLWNTNTGTVLRDSPSFDHPVAAVAFSADGTRLFTGHKGEQAVRCWDVPSLKPSLAVDGHAATASVLAFAPGGNQVVTSTSEGDFRLWDAFTGQPCRVSRDNTQLPLSYCLASAGRTWPLICENRFASDFESAVTLKKQSREFLNCSADGKRVLMWSKEQNQKPTFIVTDNRGHTVLREFIWKAGDDVTASLSPDGGMVAVAGQDVVCFLDVASGKERRYAVATRKPGEHFRTTCVKFSPEGSRVVVVGGSSMLRVISTKDSRLLAEIRASIWDLVEGSGIDGVAFSPDGKTLTVVGNLIFEGTRGYPESLSLWEVSTGQLIRAERGGRFLFSPDNNLIGILRGSSLFVHDLYSGELLREYKGETGFTGTFAFSPDGRLLAASCPDTTVLVWGVSRSKTTKPQFLDERSLKQLWRDLERAESAIAYKAIARLSADPKRSVPFLKKRLELSPPANANRIQTWIASLDDDKFAEREAASRELSNLGRLAEPAMRDALTKGVSLEARARLESLLRDLDQISPRELAHTRSIQVLEHIGTKEAQELLTTLANQTHLTQEAKAALDRFAKRGSSTSK